MDKLQRVARHGQYCDNDGERQGPPKATSEILEFGVFFLLKPGYDGLQCHATLWACTGPELTYLRMHRAGEFCVHQ
ncbi:hypothetical protein D3C73_1313760 [compost metagenome]